MRPYFEDSAAGITIYHGDCRDVLPTLETGAVATVLTDPPYGMNYDSGWSGASVHLDGTRLCLRMYRQMLPELARVMADGSHLYWFTRWDVWPDAYDAIAPFVPVRNALIWDKGHPGMGNLEVYGYSYEMAVFASKGHRALIGGRPNSIFRYPPVPIAHRKHPTEKPVALLSDWMQRSTEPGELVADPFMGSGATLAAAALLGRRFVGIEIEEKYCEVAVRRLESLPPMQFVPLATPPDPSRQLALLDGQR